MFRLNSSALPKDPEFPTDLQCLGYFIDASDDCVKSIEYPTEFFRFYISTNERYNEMRREAVHSIIREEILNRLKALDVAPLYLPHLKEARPEHEPNIAILMTPRIKLRHKKRVAVVVNRGHEDLGVWSWRMVARKCGIAGGSAVSFVKEVNRFGLDAPGLIIMNPGQLLYSHRENTTMTPTSWDSQPRESAVHLAPKVDPVHNKVKGNASVQEHIAFVFENIIASEEFVAKNAEIYLLGLGDGGEKLVEYLDVKWSDVSSRIAALALTAPCQTKFSNVDFVGFLHRRARAWNLSSHPLNTPLGNQSMDYPYQRVASGHNLYVECIMPEAYKAILEWFEAVAKGGNGYETGTLEIPEAVRKEAEERAVETAGGPAW